MWCAALITWGFLPKYLICTRCENYGKACDFTWGGRFAARLYAPQPHHSFGLSGALAEGVPGLTVLALPILAARGKFSEALPYLLLMSLWQAVLVGICCVKCVRHARDPWKARFCPSYRLAALALKALPSLR